MRPAGAAPLDDAGRRASREVTSIRAAALVVLGASFVLTPESLPRWPLCPIMALLDLPCPGCGLTRAFTCIAHGRFGEAWALHPFAFPLFVGTALLLSERAQTHAWRAIHAMGARGALVWVTCAWAWNLWRVASA